MTTATPLSHCLQDGGIKSVDVRGKTGTYMAVRRGETLIGTDISCTKCKYPLLSAEVRDCADGDGGELKCALCGAVYSLETGALTGTEAKGGIAGMIGNMMVKNDGSDLEIFGQSKPPHLGATANQQSPHSLRRYRPAPCCAWKLGCCSALRGCAERRWADGG